MQLFIHKHVPLNACQSLIDQSIRHLGINCTRVRHGIRHYEIRHSGNHLDKLHSSHLKLNLLSLSAASREILQSVAGANVERGSVVGVHHLLDLHLGSSCSCLPVLVTYLLHLPLLEIWDRNSVCMISDTKQWLIQDLWTGVTAFQCTQHGGKFCS